MEKEIEKIARKEFKIVLEKFNFDKVRNVMDYLDWHWGGNELPPSRVEMRDMVTHLFEDALRFSRDDNGITCGSGGFQIQIFRSGNVEIRFIVEVTHSV